MTDSLTRARTRERNIARYRERVAAPEVACPSCGEQMPEARLTIPMANGVCTGCNRDRPRKTFAEGSYGFKNNGSSVVALDDIEEIRRTQPVRG